MIFDDKSDFLSQCLIGNPVHYLEHVLSRLAEHRMNANTHTTEELPMLYLELA